MIKIIVADDHPMLRTGLIQSINKEVDIKVIDECESGEECLSKIINNDYDIAILDIDLPGRSGIEILGEIKKIKPEIAVLILSAYSEQKYGVRAIRAGANAYLSKEENRTALIDTLRRIKGNKKSISPKLAETLAEQIDLTSNKSLHENLSNREFEVMKAIALGKSVSEIADSLSLSVSTINTYRSRVMEKMGMKSNTQLAIYALENKLI